MSVLRSRLTGTTVDELRSSAQRVIEELANVIDGLLSAGVVAPSLTTVQRDALKNVKLGTVIYNTTTATLQGYKTSGWANL
jgi:hypothetical protein